MSTNPFYPIHSLQQNQDHSAAKVHIQHEGFCLCGRGLTGVRLGPAINNLEAWLSDYAVSVCVCQNCVAKARKVASPPVPVLTNTDKMALTKMPKPPTWFEAERLHYMVRNARSRCDRLVDAGLLETDVVGDLPNVKRVYRLKAAA